MDAGNVDLFLRMTNHPLKPDWVSHLESVGIRVDPEAYMTEEQLNLLRE